MRNNLGCAYRNRDVDAVRVALQVAAIGREAKLRRFAEISCPDFVVISR